MIYIIRHGQTALNNKKALQGRSDHPLNEVGLQQAEDAGRTLAELGVVFDRVYTSPLVRAIQTAELVAPGVEPVVDERLIEMDYGPYEGADLSNPPPEVLEFFKDFVNNPAPDGMEQLSSVVERVGTLLEDLRDVEGDILLSTHAIAMKGALEYLTPESGGAYWSKYIGNCEVYVADNTGRNYSVPKPLKESETR